MAVDPKVLAALSGSLHALQNGATGAAIPVGALSALAPLARPGMRLRIDLDATEALGAPLVLIEGPAEVRQTRPPQFSILTPRQAEVADLIATGLSNKDISLRLGISVATVKDHVHAVLTRLGLPSRSAVIAASRPSGAS